MVQNPGDFLLTSGSTASATSRPVNSLPAIRYAYGRKGRVRSTPRADDVVLMRFLGPQDKEI